MTEHCEHIRPLAHVPNPDPTELPDRAAALDRLAEVLDSGAPETTTVVAIVDIDRLAAVNDALGHDVGDRLLVSTAKRLAGAIRPDDVIARTGDDEFVVACTGLADDAAATEFGDRIRRALTGRLAVGDVDWDVSVSVGVTVAGPDAFEPSRPAHRRAQEVVSHAHTAMRAAKQRGRARSVRFDDELARRARLRTELAAALPRAWRGGQLELDYQPIFSAVDERPEGAEALLRWNHPTHGRLEAHEFVEVAEETGAIVPIGDWVLDRACESLRSLIEAEAVDTQFSMHVNATRLQLATPTFVDRLLESVDDHGLAPGHLVVEIRAACFVDHDAVEVLRSVGALRDAGVQIAIDNFGTGSEALSLLTEIGADVLKLDGGLALPAGSSETDMRVVRALVSLAHALDMQVVAGRVTGLEQLRRLRAAGCDLVQGNLLGPPAPLSELRPRMER